MLYVIAGQPAKLEQTSGLQVAWHAVRAEYTTLLYQRVFGVASVAIGIGTDGVAWVEGLARSAWFDGLTPDRNDLPPESGGEVRGHLYLGITPLHLADASTLGPAISMLLPNAPLATIAIGPSATVAELAASISLVKALRQKRWQLRCRTAVTVTADMICPAAADELRTAGAFVIHPGESGMGDHLHHFPLRCAIAPRLHGRLVCVDLADSLVCWRPGSQGHLYLLHDTFPADPTGWPTPAKMSISGLTLHWHHHLPASGAVQYLDRIADQCRAAHGHPAKVVFTTAERLDGGTGTLDLLTIETAHNDQFLSGLEQSPSGRCEALGMVKDTEWVSG